MKIKITILILLFFSILHAQEEISYPSSKSQQYAEIAEKAYAQDSLQKAEEYARFTLRELETVGARDTPTAVIWREKRGKMLYELGDLQKATDLFKENATGIERHFGKISKEYFDNRTNIVEALIQKVTNYIEALPYRQEAFTIAEQLFEESDPEFTEALFRLATAYRNAEKYDQALEIYPRLLDLNAKYLGKDHPSYGHHLIQWGIIYALRKQWSEAIPKLKEGYQIYVNALGDNGMSLLVNKHLRDSYLATGNYDKALYYSRLNEQFYYANQHLPIPDYLGYTYTIMGDIFSNTSQPDSAVIYYSKGKDFIIEHLGKDHRSYQTVTGVIAQFNQKNGDYDIAIEQYLQQLEWFEKNPDKQIFTENMPKAGLIYCYYHTKEYEKALALYSDVLEKKKEIYGESSLMVAESYMLGAYIFRGMGRETDSNEAYFKWAHTYQDFVQHIFLYLPEDRQKMLLAKTLNLRNSLLSFMVQEEEQEFISEGFNFALQYKNLILQSKIDRKNIAQHSGPEVVDLLARQQSTGVALSKFYSQTTIMQTDEFTALKSNYENLSEELAQISADLLPVQNTSWQSIQKQLKKNEAVIETVRFQYINENKEPTDSIFYFAYVLKSDAPPSRIFLFEEKETGNLAATRSRYALITDNKPSWRKLLSEKLLPHLDGINVLHYAPTGLLHRVNLGAVPVDETTVFAERFDLHLLNTSNQLSKVKKKTKRASSAVIYGGIDYDQRASVANLDTINEGKQISKLADNYRSLRDKDWEYLDWSEKEAQEISDVLRRNKITTQHLTGQNATEESFKSLGSGNPSPQILHLATHGFFFPDPEENTKTRFQNSTHPLIRSGLILAGANTSWKGGKAIEGQEDGILTAYEIAQMNLSNTDLVVLSACDTALGDIEGNEGVYGLQRAFKAAGARYILMSLWSVNDKKTYEFMTRFYDLYQNESKSIPEAYQMTQNEMRLKYALPFNPRSWAGFVLVE